MTFNQSFWFDAAYTYMIFSGVIVLLGSIFLYFVEKNRLKSKKHKRREK